LRLLRQCQIGRACASGPGKLDAHLQVRALHIELGDTVFLQEIDQLAQLFQLIAVHRSSSSRHNRAQCILSY